MSTRPPNVDTPVTFKSPVNLLSQSRSAGGYWQKNATGIHTLTSVGIGTTTADTDGAKLNVLGDTKLTGDLNVTGVSTFGGLVDINNNVTISGTLDVDAQAIFDDVTVSAAMTVTGAVDLNGGLDD